jgi:hypothetical protein
LGGFIGTLINFFNFVFREKLVLMVTVTLLSGPGFESKPKRELSRGFRHSIHLQVDNVAARVVLPSREVRDSLGFGEADCRAGVEIDFLPLEHLF